jgi:hypothetical protein
MVNDTTTADKLISEFLEYYKDSNIPNPEHNPIEFSYYVRLFKYYKKNINSKVA